MEIDSYSQQQPSAQHPSEKQTFFNNFINQKGVTPLIFILAILILSGLIIGGALYFKQKNHQNSQYTPSSATSTNNQTQTSPSAVSLNTYEANLLAKANIDTEQAGMQLTKYYKKYFDYYHLNEEVERISMQTTSTWVGGGFGDTGVQVIGATLGLKSGLALESSFTRDAILALAEGEQLPLWEAPLKTSKKYPKAEIRSNYSCVTSSNECSLIDTGGYLYCKNSLDSQRSDPRISWNPPKYAEILCTCKSVGDSYPVISATKVKDCNECFAANKNNPSVSCGSENGGETMCRNEKRYALHNCEIDFDVKLERSSDNLLSIKVTVPKNMSQVTVKNEKPDLCQINLTTNLISGENSLKTSCSYKERDNCVQFYKENALIKEVDCLRKQ